eukprot:GFUD01035796.1.p1 GENE.GFUD01035796.1~~GFUD01035796.1.p1  ORF type:complete len:1098 (-),score=441.33 GFUD01035796.1:620-3913(-)
MSGVEDVINPPPDDREKSVEKEELSDTIDGKDEDKASFTASLTDSESTSLTGSTSESWTLLEKEEEEIQKKTVESEVSEVPEVIGSSVEEVEETDQTDVTDPIDQTIKSPVEETDSESIETISDDECFVSHPLANSIHANIASFCYIPDVTDSGFPSSLTSSTSRFPSSLTSTTSTISVASDGIPIQDIEDIEDRSLGAEDGQPQYEWNNEGEKEIPEEEALSEEIEPAGEISDVEDIQEDEEDREDELEEGSNDESGERRLELSEPGYDLDDDGLPGAPLPPLNQEVELYPSQELDPSFMAIKKGEVYKHDKNLQLDHFLTAILILALALVIGLGIGHFLGLSERLEVQEMYEHLQDEKLDTLQGDLVTCIEGEEGQGGDDQDLDDRVIRQLWDENQELRDQVQQMRTTAGDQGDEAMAAILRDRINDLLTANADLEREVARLRYADAARGAAESVETLNKLRKTRDTLNDIVTENDQLKIEVAKARYGEPPAHKSTKAERDRLANENQELKNEMEKMKISNNEYKSKASDKMHEKFENALKYLEELTVEKHTLFNNNLKQDDLNTPWPSRRHEELRNEDEEEEAKVVEEKDDNDDEDNDVDEDDDNEDIKSTSMNNLSKYLSGLVGVGSKILTKQGTIDWVQAKKFVGGLKEDLSTKFEEAGKLAKEDLGIIVNKFDDLKKFVDTEKVKENMKATKTAAGKLVKSLVGAVKDLKEASEDAAEKSDWIGKFKTEAIKVKSGLETKWYEIKDKWQKVVVKNKHEDEDEDEDDHDDDDVKERSRDNRRKNDDDNDEEEDYKKNEFEEKKQKAERKRYSDDDDDDDEGYQSFDERERKGDDEHHNKKNKKRNDKRNNVDENEDEDEDHWKEKKNFKNKKDDSKNRQYWTKENKTAEAESDNWTVNRAEERDRMRRGEERSDWIFERAKHRKDARHEEKRGDWYFERKQKTDSDQHESYKAKRDDCDKDDDECNNKRQKFSKKQRRERKYNKDEDDKYTQDREFNQNKKSDKKQRGEKYVKSKNKYKTDKKDNRRNRGETDQGDDEDYEYYQFDEEVHYAERHYNDRAGKNRHEKRAKRRFSKRENEKEFVIEADFEQFY